MYHSSHRHSGVRPPSGSRKWRKWRRLIGVSAVTFVCMLIFHTLYTAIFHEDAGFQTGTAAREAVSDQVVGQAVLVEAPDWVTKDYLTPNEYSRPQTPLRHVNAIVIHYVGNPGTTAQANHNYFEQLSVTGETYASSHFVIGLDGEIIQCIPLSEIAYCSNDRNDDTIAIECCHPDADGQFNPQTYDSLLKLTRWLCDAYGLDASADVIRHYDVTGKECPKYYVEHPDAWVQFLTDLKAQGSGQ